MKINLNYFNLLCCLSSILLIREICCLTLSPVWRPVIISQSVTTSGATVSAKNAIQCIQICLQSDGCQLICFDGENCELSKILVYPGHQANPSGGTKSCYTRMNVNLAVGSKWKEPPQDTGTGFELRTFENLKDGISINSVNDDCFVTVPMCSNTLYVIIDMKKAIPVRNISITSQPNIIASNIFQDISVFVGNNVVEEAMDQGNFDLFQLVGKTIPVQVIEETQSIVLDQPKYVRYVIFHKSGTNRLQLCEVEVS